MQSNAPLIVDDFLSPAELEHERAAAMASEFDDWPGPDGQVYKRICRVQLDDVQRKIESIMGPVDMHGMAYRLNFGGELPNAAIHSDLGWGTHAMVLYLQGDDTGTAFWRHRKTGATQIHEGDQELLQQVEGDWNNPGAWERVAHVDARPGRAIFYSSATFHSRWPFAAAGTGPGDGRLIVVAFFTPHPLRKAVVRLAAECDKADCLRMGRDFYETTTYTGIAPWCEESCSALIDDLLARGLLLVANYNGRAVGMLGCYIAPFLFGRSQLMAHEVFWWVDADWRGSDVGAQLLAHMEAEAAARGVSAIQMLTLSTSPPHAAAAYRRAGYQHTETMFTKAIGRMDAPEQG
jgi:GNAT superfamily N-acetyltransferase